MINFYFNLYSILFDDLLFANITINLMHASEIDLAVKIFFSN
jgi:hypothetical protein